MKLLFCLLAAGCLAVPSFHEVNDFDVNGNACPVSVVPPPHTQVRNVSSTPPKGTEALFLAIYGAWTGFLMLNILWFAFKTSAESEFPKYPPDAPKTTTGYRDSIAGTLLFYFYVLLSLSWQGLLVFVVAEYNADVPFFATYQSLRVMLICTWHAMVLWYVVTKWCSSGLRNFYRIQTELSTAAYICIWQQNDSEVLLEDHSRSMRLLRWVDNNMIKCFGAPAQRATVKVARTSKHNRFFDFHCHRFTFVEDSGTFDAAPVVAPKGHTELLACHKGLETTTAELFSELTGPNFIRVDVPHLLTAFCQEFSSYFYLYQFSMLWIWFYWSYMYMAAVVLTVIVLSGMATALLKHASELQIKSMAESKTECKVLRDGSWAVISSLQLVPTDLIEIENNMLLPCDCVVIRGNCIADESMLTGESMPVQKFSISDDHGSYHKMTHSKKNSLFAGTRVVDVSGVLGERVLAVVVDIGANTGKGQLVADILFSTPVRFVFDEQLKLVLAGLFAWALICFGIVLGLLDISGPSRFSIGWLYGIFVICQIVSPLLPAVLVIGQSASASRMRLQQIYCVDLARITIAGKVSVFCFDKTGTLTKEGLDFYGLQPALDGRFLPVATDTSSFSPILRQAMGCAHTISKLGERLVGNPVDVEMFNTSGWSYQSHESGAVMSCPGMDDIEVLKQHEFDHGRMSMAAVVRIGAEVHVFVKGSFEAVQKLSNPASVPVNYASVAKGLAAEGCYTLGFAHRCLGIISTQHARSMSRDECEEGNDCIGLMMFRNNLKDDTADAMRALKSGAIRAVMITGDTAMTGVYIAKACGMTHPGATILLGEIAPSLPSLPSLPAPPAPPASPSLAEAKHAQGPGLHNIVWTNADTGAVVDLDLFSLDLALDEGKQEHNDESDKGKNDHDDDQEVQLLRRDGLDGLELAMTGKVFTCLEDAGLIKQLLPRCRIFARMTPTNKVSCVKLHMENNVTAMCGDGGNDCGALRAAHVGVALSEAEASIVSPFSTKDRSMFAPLTVLREGRCALVTSFSGYGFLLMYGETIVFSKFCYIYFSVQLSQWVWILLDSFFVVVLSIGLSMARPADQLAPRRPTARLLSIEPIASVTGVVLINICFLIGAIFLLFGQSFFLCNEWDASTADLSKWWLLADNFEGETIGSIAVFQVLNAAAIGNFGGDYRKPWCDNWFFALAYLGSFAVISCMLLLDPNVLGCWFRFNCGNPEKLVELGYVASAKDAWFTGDPYNNRLGHNVLPFYFRLRLWFLALGNTFAVGLWQRVVILGPVRQYLRKRFPVKRAANL